MEKEEKSFHAFTQTYECYDWRFDEDVRWFIQQIL